MALTKEDLQAIGSLLDEKLDVRFGEFEAKMDKKLDVRFGEFEAKMDEKLDVRFSEFEAKMDKKLDVRLEEFEGKLDEKFDKKLEDKFTEKLTPVYQRLDSLEQRMEAGETELKQIRFILENEVARNIQRIAEGHLDLVRRLDESLKHADEVELLSVRMNMLEGRVSRIEHRQEQEAVAL